VKSHQKISKTEGGFGGGIHEYGAFGGALTSLGDLDCDGHADLAVGAPHAAGDGGGYHRGAVWLLFLKSNGTVRSFQKISDTEGGFNNQLEDGDAFGNGLAVLGDLDGNGVVELAAGAAGDDDSGYEAGSMWVLFLDEAECCPALAVDDFEWCKDDWPVHVPVTITNVADVTADLVLRCFVEGSAIDSLKLFQAGPSQPEDWGFRVGLALGQIETVRCELTATLSGQPDSVLFSCVKDIRVSQYLTCCKTLFFARASEPASGGVYGSKEVEVVRGPGDTFKITRTCQALTIGLWRIRFASPQRSERQPILVSSAHAAPRARWGFPSRPSTPRFLRWTSRR